MVKTIWNYAETRKFKHTADESVKSWKHQGLRTKVIHNKKDQTYKIYTAIRKNQKRSAFIRDLDRMWENKIKNTKV